jgi:hypothetical protein
MLAASIPLHTERQRSGSDSCAAMRDPIHAMQGTAMLLPSAL